MFEVGDVISHPYNTDLFLVVSRRPFISTHVIVYTLVVLETGNVCLNQVSIESFCETRTFTSPLPNAGLE